MQRLQGDYKKRLPRPREDGLLNKVQDLLIVVGPKAEPPEELRQTPLIMGTCLKGLEEKGRYVVGCPPNNDKMIEAIRELCNI